VTGTDSGNSSPPSGARGGWGGWGDGESPHEQGGSGGDRSPGEAASGGGRPPRGSTDHLLARELAEQAGTRLLELRSRGGEPDVLRKTGDRLSHEFLTAQLAARRPADVVLSEEGADDPARLSANRVWIVDPLDGTREFGEPGRTDWAVHVALWERAGSGRAGLADAGELTAGAVALPAQGKVLSTVGPGEPPRWPIGVPITTPTGHQGGGSGRDGVHGSSRIQAGGTGGAKLTDGKARSAGRRGGDARIRIVVSRSRAPRLVQDISALIGAELIPLGSAGAKVAAVVCGEADAYVHAGGFYEWDTAAPVAVARAAGLHASRIDGSPLAYNQANLKMPDILVCLPALAGPLLQAIREVTNAL
jgi:3'(2'), 5'-bisphosphate nucleotidase